MIEPADLQRLAALCRATFTLDRDLVVFDLETTSPNPDEARIVEFGMINVKLDGTDKVYRTLVNPGVPIPEEASHGRPGSGYQGHGITDSLVQGCRHCGSPEARHADNAALQVGAISGCQSAEELGLCSGFAPWPRFENIATSIQRGFSGGAVDFAGTNIRFDLRVTRAELGRVGIADWDYPDARIVDVYRIEQVGEPRTLSAIYEKYYGHKFDGAHGALNDVMASIEVLNAQVKRFQHLPRSLDLLHAMIWDGWIDTDGKFSFVNGVPTVTFGKKWKGTDMRRVDRDYYRWMIKPEQNFAPSTKSVAAAAVQGVFPTAD